MVLSALRGGCSLRYDPHLILDDLQEAAFDIEAATTFASNAERSLAEERHHRRVPGENANLAIERGRDDGLRLTLEQDRFR